MKKLLLLICMFLILPAGAETLHGGASYTVNSVRTMLQQGLQKEIPTDSFKNKLYDHANYRNIALLKKGITETKNKKLYAFYNIDKTLNSYGIIYKYDLYHSYLYYSSGILKSLAISDKLDGEYPNKFYLYNSRGKLTGYGLDVTDKEIYVYFSSGRLDNHCVGNTCYDENNRVLWTRDY